VGAKGKKKSSNLRLLLNDYSIWGDINEIEGKMFSKTDVYMY
jgi:hypothetical protein